MSGKRPLRGGDCGLAVGHRCSTAAPAATPSPRRVPPNDFCNADRDRHRHTPSATPSPTVTPTPPHPLSVEFMRQQSYPGSPLTVEQTLQPGSNYQRFIASYFPRA